MPVRNALDALTMRPTRFLVSSWPWRSLAYLTGGALLGVATAFVVLGLLGAGLVLSVVVIGVAGYLATVLSGVAVGRLERWRMRLIDREALPDPHRRPPEPGLRAWLMFRLREQATWRELGYAMMSALVLCWMDAAVVGTAIFMPATFLFAPLYIDEKPLSATLPLTLLAPVAAVIAAYPVTAWAGARAAMARAILAPRSDDTDAKLVELTRSRARLVDAFEVERRRIERDLHDGAQQRLVALSMQLGLARLELAPGSPAETSVVAAQDLAKQALAELRELIRGVHPKILTDRGLAAAVGEAAGHAPVPVRLDLRLTGRLPQPVEVAAYFVVVEALANIAKHSGAAGAAVSAGVHGGRLRLDVRDDGRGGADPDRGTGLVGLADRVAAVGGSVALSSPPGGPTLVHVEIPCGS
ncbi:histidine kinase [Actinoplanes sp. NBRC 14428]|uniref:histidine kinase n=1 Tax=Pseudosporangium ferrugineum TaxID=439699 RepID=A0A2T0SJH6_9ACTN|nr:sensor histidine kinase [Pseudosporangium ferrugineum]PRY33564.1 signal transduction histidine kinase [Pseudosporangium ferrugineum]BCJ56486.1 histidine kinase [Actinoplanes sp. NBRC 14428]